MADPTQMGTVAPASGGVRSPESVQISNSRSLASGITLDRETLSDAREPKARS